MDQLGREKKIVGENHKEKTRMACERSRVSKNRVYRKKVVGKKAHR